jgi:hypothetical protein
MKNPLKKILKKSPAPPSVFFHQQKNKKEKEKKNKIFINCIR